MTARKKPERNGVTAKENLVKGGASVGRPAVKKKRKETRELGLTGLRRAKREEQERGGWSFKERRETNDKKGLQKSRKDKLLG